jgi:hypothetical protein
MGSKLSMSIVQEQADNMQDKITYITHGKLCVMNAPKGARLGVENGSIWLTEEGIAADIILQAGHVYRLRHGGRLLIDSPDQACIRLHVQQPVGNEAVEHVDSALV